MMFLKVILTKVLLIVHNFIRLIMIEIKRKLCLYMKLYNHYEIIIYKKTGDRVATSDIRAGIGVDVSTFLRSPNKIYLTLSGNCLGNQCGISVESSGNQYIFKETTFSERS